MGTAATHMLQPLQRGERVRGALRLRKKLPEGVLQYPGQRTKWHYIEFRSGHRDARQEPGVYVIFANGAPIYIGQSQNVRARFKEHGFRNFADFEADARGYTTTPWGNVPFGSDLHARVCYPKRYGEWLMLEARLIRRLKPTFNRLGLR